MCGNVLATMLIAVALFPSVGWADDESDDASGQPDYTAEALIFVQADLRHGWELIDDEGDLPDHLPTEDRLSELAGDEAFDLTIEYRLLQHEGGAKAVVSIIDVEMADGPAKFRKALDKTAKKCGWSVSELGDPTRLLVVAGTPDDVKTLTKWQIEQAAKTLAAMAYERIVRDDVGGKPGPLTAKRATEYITAAESLVEGVGGAGVVRGIFQFYDGKFDEGFETIDRATAENAPIPAPPGLIVFALSMQARVMLALERADLDVKVVDVLNRAIELEDVAFEEADRLEQEIMRVLPFQNHYYMGVAQARLENNDDVFASLERAMTLGKKTLYDEMYWRHFLLVWFWDESFEEIRKDERFEEFANRFAPAGFDFEEQRKACEEEKARIEEARKKAEEEKKKAEEEKKKTDDEKEKEDGEEKGK